MHRTWKSITAGVHHLTGSVFTPRQHVGPALTEFSRVTADDVFKVVGSMCRRPALDLLPSSLLREGQVGHINVLLYDCTH